MRFECDRCGKRYSAAEPLREGRTYSIRCRSCGHKIVLRASAGAARPAAPAHDPEPELPTVLPPREGAPGAGEAPNAPELEAAFEGMVTPAQAFRLAPPPIPRAPAAGASPGDAPPDEELVEATTDPTPVSPPAAIGSWSDMHPLAPREPLRDPLPPAPPAHVSEERPPEPGIAGGHRLLWLTGGGVAVVAAVALVATFTRGPQPAAEERPAPARPPRPVAAAPVAPAPPPAPPSVAAPEPAAATADARPVERGERAAPRRDPPRPERAPPAPSRKPTPPARVAAAPARAAPAPAWARPAAPDLPVIVVAPEAPAPAATPPEPRVASLAPRAPAPEAIPPAAEAPAATPAPPRAVEPPAEARPPEPRPVESRAAPRPPRPAASRPAAPPPRAPAPASEPPDEGRGDVLRLVLRKDVDGLGRSGETVEVPAGYGRSFLLAKGLAVAAAGRKVAAAAQAQDDEPVMPGAGYRRPVPTTPQCVERNLRVPSDRAGGDGRSVTIRFAVGRTGIADLVNVEPGPGWPAGNRVEPRLVEAVNSAVRSCRFTPGSDEQGRPARLWVVMQVPVGGS
jgi:DNA-directed RNA polymerase subunit RPC12/RpoP